MEKTKVTCGLTISLDGFAAGYNPGGFLGYRAELRKDAGELRLFWRQIEGYGLMLEVPVMRSIAKWLIL